MKNDKGFSLIELLIVVVIIGIIAAIAVPNLLASRRSANGASAVQTMRLFHSTEATYQAGIGNGSFGNATNLFYEDFIDPVVASAVGVNNVTSRGGQISGAGGRAKSGYLFGLTFNAAGNGSLSRFSATGYTAGSFSIARTGDRNFYIDESGVIRASASPTVVPNNTSAPLGN